MQTRLMQLMADKLTSSLTLEGELSDKGLVALSESSDSMARELAKMFLEKSSDNRSLKDIWAAYRKKEIHAEVTIATDIDKPIPQRHAISQEEQKATPEISKASSEIEQIGDTLVKVEFIEYVGKRKKKVTRVEVKHSSLDQVLDEKGSGVGVQFALF
jgi:hypothetical protein